MAISIFSIGVICLVCVVLSIAMIDIKEKSSDTLPAPMMFDGLSNTHRHAQGPWPECLELNGEACVALLELYTEGLDIELVSTNAKVEENGFRPYRVRVHVDAESNVVIATPKRG